MLAQHRIQQAPSIRHISNATDATLCCVISVCAEWETAPLSQVTFVRTSKLHFCCAEVSYLDNFNMTAIAILLLHSL